MFSLSLVSLLPLILGHHKLQAIKDITEITAYFFAAIFFLYKSYGGYFLVNLSLSVECRRERARATGED